MKRNYKHILIVLLLAVMLVLPGIAGAATLYNVKVTINGQTHNLQIPLELNSKSESFTKTYRFVYTYKDGKWILSPGKQTQTPVPTPPKQEEKTDEKPSQDVKGLTADEQKMLNLVNAERQKAGLAPLKNDMKLVDISRKKSKDMIDKNYFSHTSPTYGTPFEALKNNGVTYRYAGENLAGASNVEEAHKALMASPGHRANILNPNYNYIGIGIIDGGPYGKMYTQTFIGTK